MEVGAAKSFLRICDFHGLTLKRYPVQNCCTELLPSGERAAAARPDRIGGLQREVICLHLILACGHAGLVGRSLMLFRVFKNVRRSTVEAWKLKRDLRDP